MKSEKLLDAGGSPTGFRAVWKKYRNYFTLLYLPFYLAAFFLVERIVTDDVPFLSTVLPVDAYIPFCEWAIVPYMLWFPLMVIVGLYLLFTDDKALARYMRFLALGFFSTILFCFLVPNGTAPGFRPDLEALGRSNIATKMCGAIYAADTYTNVLPSIHVVGSFMSLFGFLDSKIRKNKTLLVLISILAALIVASTVLVKQHAVIDIVVGIVWSLADGAIIYLPGLLRKRKAKKEAEANG
ncbi:MAG: phosphatase PAP2 family protein [Lachnospiraceae bacterium]|nr:phosphatase PAP2 family protein [Lachnospiraceae bacterium]